MRFQTISLCELRFLRSTQLELLVPAGEPNHVIPADYTHTFLFSLHYDHGVEDSTIDFICQLRVRNAAPEMTSVTGQWLLTFCWSSIRSPSPNLSQRFAKVFVSNLRSRNRMANEGCDLDIVLLHSLYRLKTVLKCLRQFLSHYFIDTRFFCLKLGDCSRCSRNVEYFITFLLNVQIQKRHTFLVYLD
jgi:hypothetical protein